MSQDFELKNYDHEQRSHVEQHILAEQLKVDAVSASILSAFSFATQQEKIILVASSVFAFIAGVCQVLPTIIFGLLAGAFLQIQDADDDETLVKVSTNYILALVCIGIGAFFAHFLATSGFVYVGDRITVRIRTQFLQAIFEQNIGFFDGQGRESLVSQLTSNGDVVREGISQKLSFTISAVGCLLGTLVVGLVLNPRLTGIAVWSIVVTFILAAGANFVAIVHGGMADKIRTESLNLLEETLRAIKSVIALTAEKDILARFRDLNAAAAASGYRLRSLIGTVMGGAVAIGYLSVALILWQGHEAILAATASYSSVIAIALLFKSAAFAVLGVGAYIESFAKAGTSLGEMLSIIQRKHPQDDRSRNGFQRDALLAPISFTNIRFAYPTRPGTIIFDDLQLTIEALRMTTIIGASGSGKSAIIDMLLGFYPVLDGNIRIGGVNVQNIEPELILKSARIVRQSPTLFEERTIYENIVLGLDLEERNRKSAEELMKLVERACHIAEAHSFILYQHRGYNTILGSRGETLSGGEKQRIALARALINEPRILILDEATSALDNATEMQVLENVRNWQKGRATVINISHRLCSAKLADEVVVLKDGRVLDQGHFDTLLRSKTSSYFRSLTVLENNETLALDSSITEAFDKIVPKPSESTLRPMESMSSVRPLLADSAASEIVPKPSESTLRPMESMSSVRPLLAESATRKPTTESLPSQGETRSAPASTWTFLWSMCRPDWAYIFVGGTASILMGLEEPISAVLFAYAVIELPNSQDMTTSSSIGSISLGFLALGIGQCLMFLAQAFTFARVAENMGSRTRNLLLENFLARDVSFYERNTTTVAGIVRLIFDATESMTGFSGFILGAMITGTTTIIAGFILACVFGWQLALVCSTTLPIIVLCGVWGVLLMEKLKDQIERHQVKSAEIGTEAISQIQTVVAFGLQQDILARYTAALDRAHKQNLRTNLKLSLIYAVTQALLYFCMSLGFWFGLKLLYAGTYSLFQVVLVYSSVIMSAYSAGVIFSFAPDLGKARKGTAGVMQALMTSGAGLARPLERFSADHTSNLADEILTLEDVYFAYPAQPDRHVLRDVSLRLYNNQHIAIVGQTGSGKSTLMSILARFHEPDRGSFSFEGENILDIDTNLYRKDVAVVLQESILFQGTIQQNLVLGLSYEPTLDQIREACIEACIWDFIQSLPDGLQTSVGWHGTTLSGGQCQRLSLARAFLRDVKVLLLDEATSALDLRTESEILNNLEKSKKDRAIISVSHRQEVIRRADHVYVLNGGRVCEDGDYPSLIAKRGVLWAISETLSTIDQKVA